MPCSQRVQVTPAGEKVLVDQPDQREAVGHNTGLRKVLVREGAIRTGQIHADQPDV